ncbi:MAG: ABC transporter permease [Bauldia sp.]|nr:ABC transporter permease [Bauldia sp.]
MKLVLALVAVAALAIASLFIGISDVSLASLFAADNDGRSLQILLASRIPRTAALILAGTATAVAGLVMQMLTRNRFVEPTTAGTVEAATLGILAVMLLYPGAPVIVRMLIAAGFGLGGTMVFLAILRRLPPHAPLLVPLVGILLGGVLGAVAVFFAYQNNLLQSLAAWTNGDFSAVLRGRYELLWITAALTIVAYLAADRFTVAGLGSDLTTSLGLNYRRVLSLGLVIVSLVTASVVVTVGIIPFLGLVVPNVVSILLGDNVRRSLPFVALFGAGFVLACDIAGRLVRYPYEIPIGTVVGVVGSALFLWLLLRRRAALG